MDLKVRDDAPTSLTLYKRVGEYVDGTPRTGDAISFGPGDEIPDEYAVYIRDAFEDKDHPEHAHIRNFVESLLPYGTKTDGEAGPDPVGDDVDALKGAELDAAVEAAGIDASTGGSRSDGGLTADEKREALRAHGAGGGSDNPFVT